MANRTQHVRPYDKITTHLINGYILRMQNLLPYKENSYYTIPEVINHVCLSFYFDGGIFNIEKHGGNLRFINDKTVKKVNNDENSVVSIGTAISRNKCDMFKIEWCFNGIDSRSQTAGFGYYAGKYQQLMKSTDIDWNQPIGLCDKQKSFGYSFSPFSNNHLFTWDKHRPYVFYGKWIALKQPMQNGDTYTLQFDFTQSKGYVYHNEEKVDHVFELASDHIIPLVSLHTDGDCARITKYQFIY